MGAELPFRKFHFLYGFLGALALLFVLLLVLFFYLNSPVEPGSSKRIDFVVGVGEPSSSVVVRLEKKGLIRNAIFARSVLLLKGWDRKVKRGVYSLSPSMTTYAILSTLVHGRVKLIQITVPEGYTMYQIASLMEEKGFFDAREFLELCKSRRFMERLRLKGIGAPEEAKSLEGYLFPDTYYLPEEITPEELITIMNRNFWRVFKKYEKRALEIYGGIHPAVTMASLVEKEAAVDRERPIIAAVFLNRLRRGIPLQSDPSVLYAKGIYTYRRVFYRDLKYDSPYNTYLHRGLPPGPICNPGEASIRASVYPADVDYLYFVSRGDGTHAFAKTKEEHIRNIRKYRKKYLEALYRKRK